MCIATQHRPGSMSADRCNLRDTQTLSEEIRDGGVPQIMKHGMIYLCSAYRLGKGPAEVRDIWRVCKDETGTHEATGSQLQLSRITVLGFMQVQSIPIELEFGEFRTPKTAVVGQNDCCPCHRARINCF